MRAVLQGGVGVRRSNGACHLPFCLAGLADTCLSGWPETGVLALNLSTDQCDAALYWIVKSQFEWRIDV